MSIQVIGGTYKEYCAWPLHDTMQGSAGRAALCLSQLDPTLNIRLHARIAPVDVSHLEELFAFNTNCTFKVYNCKETTRFDYFHPLAEPKITPKIDTDVLPKFDFTEETFGTSIIFGMIEATPSVNCKVAVYDPQNTYKPILFSETGSTADHLTYVTNRNELSLFFKQKHNQTDSVEKMAKWLLDTENAQAIVVKCGQAGLYVTSADEDGWISPFKTKKVFPIGSGDSFVAAFAYYWTIVKQTLKEAARKASVAAAYYVSNKTMNNENGLKIFEKTVEPIVAGTEQKSVYLAGPFFTLSELWMVNEAKYYLESFGMQVFSPYHAIGIGTAEEVVQKDIDAIMECDVMYALFDGTDPGTLFEIGYARSLNKPVVVFAENPKSEELKMYDGSGCRIFDDFASSIYHTAWLDK